MIRNLKQLEEVFNVYTPKPHSAKHRIVEQKNFKVKEETFTEYLLVMDVPNCGDWVFHGDNNPKNGSCGFGGDWMSFSMVDGTELKLKGPWHSSDDRFHDKHLTMGVICTSPIDMWKPQDFEGVVFMDEVPVVGEFQRITDLCERMVIEKYPQGLHCYTRTSGGASGNHFASPAKAWANRNHWIENGYRRETISG